jgi:NADPH:quinone reductase-like Zn-dependent oxidoreductase
MLAIEWYVNCWVYHFTNEQGDCVMSAGTMKAVRIHQYGGPEEVLYGPQEIAPDAVLIRVSAAGVNPIDYQLRSGFVRQFFDIPFPYTLGREVAGVIEQVGAQVDTLHMGDEVFALLSFQGGGYAEYVVVKAAEVALKPTSLNFVHAAAVPLTAQTAWQALFEHGKLHAGQRVLIHAASEGVGLFAVQFAHAVGAHVFATTSKPFEEVAQNVDVVLDPLGGEVQARSWQALRPGGILVSIFQPPAESEAQKHHVSAAFFPVRTDAAQLAEIARKIDGGEIRVVLEKEFDLHDAKAALQLSEAGHVRGKLTLRVR